MLDIRKLLVVMNEHDASDLYLTAEFPPSYRVNGVVRKAGNRALEPQETEELALSILNEKQQRGFEEKNEMNIGLHYQGIGRFRINIFRQRTCVGLVIRMIKSKIPNFEQLQLPAILKDIAMSKRGLVLVVGATGSGKSTSLAAMIDHRNANSPGHIITIEDPIEYVYEHKQSLISQREIGMDTESYHIALKNALRQAPDVVLIGEIRDAETMEAAITFAETGHLCLATLHSTNAYQAMERVMNFFPAERHKQIYLQLAMNLKSIISQRLIKTIDGQRVAAVEILLASPRVKDLVLKGEIESLHEAMEKGTVIGMQTFDTALFELFKSGKISLEEALRNADSTNNLRLKIKLADDGSLEQPPAPFTSPKPTEKKSSTVLDEDELSLALDRG